jgi:steroid delta-isomerase-like uncharacterized protein
MSEKNKAIACREFKELWNEGKKEVIEEIYDAKIVGHNPGNPNFGMDWAKEWFDTARAAFPDMHFTIEDVVAEGNMVATRWTFEATHEGEFMGIARTGKKVKLPGLGMCRIEGGKIVELWGYWDNAGMMQQLGVS